MKCCGTKKNRDDFKKQARIHKALGNEARLMIVESLRNCECTVGQLAHTVDLDMSTVSKHLSVLVAAGILDNRKDGSNVHYRLLTPCVLDMFECTTKVIDGSTEDPLP